MARTVWCPATSGLPSAAPKGARKSRGCAEAYMGTASRSVEILVLPPPQAVAILAGGPTAQGGKGHFPDGN